MRGVTPLLEVFNIERSLEFYCDRLGFEVLNISEGRGWCMLRCGDVRLMLNGAYEHDERPELPIPERVRWHWDLTLYFDADPRAIYQRLNASGWNVQEPYVAPYGVLQVNASDPDGYSLAFVEPTIGAARRLRNPAASEFASGVDAARSIAARVASNGRKENVTTGMPGVCHGYPANLMREAYGAGATLFIKASTATSAVHARRHAPVVQCSARTAP